MAETAQRDAGRRLSLGIPYNWYVEVQPAEELHELDDHIIGDLLCCPEVLTPIGRCVVERPGGAFERTGLVVMMGYRTRIYIYDTKSECMVMASYHLDNLARFGLIMCECVYRCPCTPYATRYPVNVVRGLLSRSQHAWEMLDFAAAHAGTDIALHTPGRRTRPLRLVSGFSGISDLWPFAAIPQRSARRCRMSVTLRLCCSWRVLGAVGAYRNSGYFHVSHVIIVDRFAVFYTLEIKTGELYRIADNVHEFFKGGLTKTTVFRRYDHFLRSVARVERAPRCHHVPYDVLRPSHTVYAACVQHDFSGQYAWLCRPGRFRENMMCTWDREDSYVERAARARVVVPLGAGMGIAAGAAARDPDAAEPDVVQDAHEEVADDMHEGQLPPPQRWVNDDDVQRAIVARNRNDEDQGLDLTEDANYVDVNDHIYRSNLADRLVSAYDSEEEVTEAEVESRRVMCCSAAMDSPSRVVFSFRPYIS